MRWYWISCEGCGWKAKQMVDESVKDRFLKEVRWCAECIKAGRIIEYTAREVITSTKKG